jgi:predicted kinase
VTRLALINGLPASGKSTLARRYGEDHPLCLVLDIDVVRSMLGAWLQHPQRSGLQARQLAMAMARTQLMAEGEVLVPQFLARVDFVLELEALCAELGVPFVEIALLCDPGEAAARFLRRTGGPDAADATAEPVRPEHRDAAQLLERAGGTGELVAMAAGLDALLTRRPNTHVLHTLDGDVERTYHQLLEVMATPPG